MPPGQEGVIALKAELARIWPMIDTKKDPQFDAKDWEGIPDKLQYLEP